MRVSYARQITGLQFTMMCIYGQFQSKFRLRKRKNMDKCAWLPYVAAKQGICGNLPPRLFDEILDTDEASQR